MAIQASLEPNRKAMFHPRIKRPKSKFLAYVQLPVRSLSLLLSTPMIVPTHSIMTTVRKWFSRRQQSLLAEQRETNRGG